MQKNLIANRYEELLQNLLKIKLEIFKINHNNKKCGCKARILIVDDNQFNIMPVAHLIKEYFDI